MSRNKHEIIISKSEKPDKKLKAVIDGTKTIHFGAAGMSDYTKHKDKERKARYESRHKKNENWTASGFKTAGFYSKNILWNKPTIQGSIRDINDKFGSLHVKFKG
jgi:hypothetical protein